MDGGHVDPISTWWAAVAFMAIFWGHRIIRLLNRIGFHGRSVISFGAGMDTAYVFVHVMPELSTLRHEFVEAVSICISLFQGMVIYFIALAGFLRSSTASITGAEPRPRSGRGKAQATASMSADLRPMSASSPTLSSSCRNVRLVRLCSMSS